jgi:hypothetical protein
MFAQLTAAEKGASVQATGRTKGGRDTKVHAISGAHCRPLAAPCIVALIRYGIRTSPDPDKQAKFLQIDAQKVYFRGAVVP